MLADQLKILLGSTMSYYWKAHAFHMNVEGSDFFQYHKLFQEVYETAYGTIDTIGEYIRTMDSYSPPSLQRLCELSLIEEQTKIPRAELMMAELYQDSEKMCQIANATLKCATEENVENIANYTAELLDIYKKHSWFLKSTLKKNRE